MSNAAKKLESLVNEIESEHGSGDESSMMLAALHRSQAVIEFGLDGKVQTANENFLATTGYSLSEIQGQHHSMFCDPEYVRSADYKAFWDGLRRGEFQAGEFRRVGKNGREIWLTASYNPILDAQGRPYKVVKFAQDITESKQELQARIDIMDATSIVSEANLRGDIMNVNEKFVQVSKYSSEELIGKGHNTTRHPDMPKEVFKEMWATIGRGKMFRGVVKNRAKDGTPYYVDACIQPILGPNGKPRKYLGVRYDITDLEIERQNSRGLLRAINSSFAYIEFDTKGNVLQANENFQAALGYSAEELKGRHHRTFCDAELVKSSDYADFWRDLAEGKSKSGIFRRVKKSGEEIYINAVYAPVTDEVGRVFKVVKLALDVTEQQRMIIAVQETASALSAASTELTATATQMSSTASRTGEESITAATSAEQVSAGVQTVATNVEEMVASIKEIARSTNESSQMAKMTMTKAQESNETVVKLGVSSQEIGDVIKVISSIAQQTNLLALNATIEAARAGEAGKGFAVVANEVKELAKQTAKATNDITNKIGAIQHDTKSAVDAIGGISQAVEKLNSIAGVIAAAVEEQTATTNEISRVVVQSKAGVESIAATVKTVSVAANESTIASNQTLEASKELSKLAERLNALVKKSATSNR
jgi:methyl-accepting chemotaxis protein